MIYQKQDKTDIETTCESYNAEKVHKPFDEVMSESTRYILIDVVENEYIFWDKYAAHPVAHSGNGHYTRLEGISWGKYEAGRVYNETKDNYAVLGNYEQINKAMTEGLIKTKQTGHESESLDDKVAA